MNLSITERIILYNQYKILESLYPEEADIYSINREIIENGYILHYSELAENITSEMSQESSKEVLDILDMYRALYFSVEEEKKEKKSKFAGKKIWFPGFDGNNETEQLVYTKFFLHKMQRYEELHHPGEYPDYNSHSYTLDQYRKMIEIWKKFGQNVYKLSRNQIDQLLEEAVYGTLRDIKNDAN